MTELPTKLSDDFYERILNAKNEFEYANIAQDVLYSHERLERDVITMALRLFGEDENTFAPETRECMARWRPIIEDYLQKIASGMIQP